jgi:hypothetical protein
MRNFLLSFLFLAACSLLNAQQALNKDGILKLETAGISDSVIIAMINSSPCSFDTSPEGVIELKNAGVHDNLVIAILQRMNQLAHPEAAAGSGSARVPDDPDDPMTPHEAGVYLMADSSDGKPKMVFVDRVGEAAMKVSNLMGAAFSFGAAKMKLRAEIPAPHATVRSTDSRPVFYMYFPDISSYGAFSGIDMVSSPNQFTLLALDELKDHRETVVASAGLTGGSIGADQKKSILFRTDRIRPRAYKVTPSVDLKPGEYAFVAVMPGLTPETPPNMVVYDFGVDPK